MGNILKALKAGLLPMQTNNKQTNNLRGLSPRANYADQATLLAMQLLKISEQNGGKIQVNGVGVNIRV
jgi:hypothetical protein